MSHTILQAPSLPYFYNKNANMNILFPRVAARLLLLVSIITAGLASSSCKKDDEKDYTAIDEAVITKYLADNNITTAVKQPNGLYVVPLFKNPNGAKITAGTYVSVLYTGRLLDAAGTVFDASSRRNNVPLTFMVGGNQLIQGFESGIATLNIGDKAELLIPSRLGYGSAGSGGVPKNTVTRFEVEVVDYKPIDDALIVKYLADKNITTAVKQPSGLYFRPITTNPAGARPVAGSTVSVLYTGRLLDAAGTIFDASANQNNVPFNVVLGANQVIKGFEEGISLLRKGEKAEVYIPSGLAYGPRGAGTVITSNAVIRFEIEIVDVK